MPFELVTVERSPDDWYQCFLRDGKFEGAGAFEFRAFGSRFTLRAVGPDGSLYLPSDGHVASWQGQPLPSRGGTLTPNYAARMVEGSALAAGGVTRIR